MEHSIPRAVWQIPDGNQDESSVLQLSGERENDERMDNIVLTVTGKLQELLLRVDGLTVEKAVKVCRAYEQSTKQVKEFRDDSNPSNSSTKVNQVAQKPERQFCNYL